MTKRLREASGFRTERTASTCILHANCSAKAKFDDAGTPERMFQVLRRSMVVGLGADQPMSTSMFCRRFESDTCVYISSLAYGRVFRVDGDSGSH